MCSHPVSQGVVIIAASILPKNIHISYAESERGKETVKRGEEFYNLTNFAISVQIILGHLNFYITATTFMWSHFRKSPRPHSAGWRHRWLHIEETFKVENTTKTRFACTCMILTVISGFIIKRHYIFLPLKCAGSIEKILKRYHISKKKIFILIYRNDDDCNKLLRIDIE